MISHPIIALIVSLAGAYANGSGNYPNCSQINRCAHGGQGGPVSDGDINSLPRCWFKFNGESEFGCYNALNNSCNNIRDVNMFDTNKCKQNPKPVPNSAAGVLPNCQQIKRCAHGGQGGPVSDGDINSLPRCWFKFNGESEFGCYNALNNSCDNIRDVNMFDTNTCKQAPKPTPNPAVGVIPDCKQINRCAHGGQGGPVSDGDINSLPRCWFKFDGESEFGCYNPLNNSCNNIRDVNMFDTNTCKTNPNPNPAPQSCPDLKLDVCRNIQNGAEEPISSSPQFWVKDGSSWKCSDNKHALSHLGSVYDLNSPPHHCLKNQESPYQCY